MVFGDAMFYVWDAIGCALEIQNVALGTQNITLETQCIASLLFQLVLEGRFEFVGYEHMA